MSQVDASIPLQVRSPQIPDPVEQYSKLAALQNMLQQGKMQGQALQENDLKLQQMKQDMQDQLTARQILSESNGDLNAAKPKLVQALGPKALPILENLTKHDQAIANLDETQAKAGREKLTNYSGMIDQIMSLPSEQRNQAYQHKIGLMVKTGAIPQQMAAGLPPEWDDEWGSLVGDTMKQTLSQLELKTKQAAQEHAESMNPILEREAAAKTRTAEQAAAGTTPITPFQQEELNRKTVPVDQQEMQDWLNKNKGKGPADFMKYKATLVPQYNFNINQGQLSEDDLKREGQKYAMTGVMPSMGMGNAQVRNKIIHYANDWARQNKMSPGDVAAGQAAFAGDKKSLESLQKQRDAVVSFENTALKNLDQFIAAAQKIVDTGVPWANVPVRMVSEKMVGSGKIAAFNVARDVAKNEIAKVLTSPGLSNAPLSDSARKEVEGYMGKDMTLRQYLSVAKILKQDMANRHNSYDAMLGEIKGRIGGGQSGGSSQPGKPKSDPLGIF